MNRNITLAFVLVGIVLLPSAVAIPSIIIPVNTQAQVVYHFEEPPLSSAYTLQLSGNVFTEPVYHALNLVTYHMGEVERSHTVHVVTDWRVNGTNVTMRSFGEKTYLGRSYAVTIVEVNGSRAWTDYQCEATLQTCGALGSRFDYDESHMLIYAENQSAYVPVECDTRTPTYSFPADYEHSIEIPCSEVIEGVTGLFYVLRTNQGRYLDAVNSTHNNGLVLVEGPVYWLANASHPQTWSFNTTYQDRAPDSAFLTYQFNDEATWIANVQEFAASDQSCGGFSALFRLVTGVCPTLTGVARFGIELVPNILAFFLDFVSPEAGGFIRLLGEIAGEFVASYIFVLVLIAGSIGRILIVAAATISGFAFVIGGIRGDMGVVASAHIAGVKYLAIGVFWYFYIYYLLGRWIVELILKIVDTIGNFVPFT